MAEDVALGGPLVVKPGGPVGTVHPAAGPWDCRAQNTALGNPQGPSPTPASVLGSVWEIHREFHQQTFHLPFGQTRQRPGWTERTWVKSDATSRSMLNVIITLP